MFTIAFTILATIFIIKMVISDAMYNKLLILPIFFAIVIGAISSWNKIMAE
ncbi:hypothetical protein C900_04305 [Fulvivirga imtechensis AK7]|uniref:Uncharacterized protein n=1 Tax=Fulvivirga imtechensis AK7 TaxID=1237149 RepID=L8JZ46_9BACT|nr:hypothetical protein C900_04305 [Fulvivirga imtechensis AK7]